MPFPYGGSMTHAELAKRFGWPSVIISTALLPFNLFWSKLFASPVSLKSKPKYTFENCLIDEEGGKFFQSSCGIIHCLDIQVKRDINNRISRMIVTPNFLSWLTLDDGYMEFANTPQGTFGHRLRFFYPLDGPNMYNPFAFHIEGFVVSGMGYFSNVSFNKREEICELLTTISETFPDEPVGEEREDRHKYTWNGSRLLKRKFR